MLVTLSIAWIGTAVPPMPLRGTVHSAFGRACNLACGQELVALLHPALPRLGWGCRLKSLPFAWRDWLQPGDAFFSRNQTLYFPTARLNLDFSQAALWKGDQPVANGNGAGTDRLCRILSALFREHHWPGLSKLFCQEATMPPDGSGNAPVAACPNRGPQPLLEHKLLAVTAAFPADLERNACDLLGLGNGLTPAGDDFLVGFLAGLHCRPCPANRDRLHRLQSIIRRQAPKRTHALSLAFLLPACTGRFPEDLAALVRLAHVPDATATTLRQTAARVLHFGHTSGADTLTGMLRALETEKVASDPGLAYTCLHKSLFPSST